jgi:hypothetical protein
LYVEILRKYVIIIGQNNIPEEQMKRSFIALILSAMLLIPVFAAADDENSSDDFIDAGTVQKHDNSNLLDSGTVEKVDKPTAVPTAVPPAAEPTAVPTKKPVERPAPRPTPRPTPRKTVKRAPTPVPTPTLVPTPSGRPAEFSITSASAEELAKKRTFQNYFGILDRDRKFRMIFTVQNTGDQPSLYTGASLLSGHTSIIIADKDKDKDLQTVLAKDKRELTFEILILGSYDGDSKLPLTLKMKYNGVEKDYPLDISIEPENPFLLYGIIAGVLLLIIIIIILVSRRGGDSSRRKKDYDFEMK